MNEAKNIGCSEKKDEKSKGGCCCSKPHKFHSLFSVRSVGGGNSDFASNLGGNQGSDDILCCKKNETPPSINKNEEEQKEEKKKKPCRKRSERLTRPGCPSKRLPAWTASDDSDADNSDCDSVEFDRLADEIESISKICELKCQALIRNKQNCLAIDAYKRKKQQNKKKTDCNDEDKISPPKTDPEGSIKALSEKFQASQADNYKTSQPANKPCSQGCKCGQIKKYEKY